MEKRYINTQMRMDGESKLLSGRAIVFNSDSADMGFIERILPSAITEETINNSDIVLTFNHDESNVLARSRNGQGSLAIEVNSDGVDFLTECPDTQLGRDLTVLMQRGDIDRCSFAFTIPEEEGAERWYRDGDTIRRDIMKIDRLYDLSIVTTPAYPETKASARSLDKLNEFKALEDKYNQLKQEIELL